MKIIYKIQQLIVVVCVLNAMVCFAQPVIKVPPMCEVVVAGTGSGANIGFGAAVGDGGIVVMPDSFDFPGDEGNFYYVSNEFELIQWELLGDLSTNTETNFNEVLQPTGAINPLNIQSYNKNLRFGEMPSLAIPNLNTRWARSKGRIIITYFDKRCKSKIKFDVYKRYKNDREKNLVPPIIGSDCVLPNTVYTFSVDPIASDNPNDEIGFDHYYWSNLPEGHTLLYNSPDNSSITIRTGENIPSFTLQCCYGRANEWDGENSTANYTTCVNKLIISTATNPEYIMAPPTCHPTGTSSFSIVYPNITSGSYAWTSSNLSWQITSAVGTTNTTVTVTTPDNNSGTLNLAITSICNNVVNITYTVNRSLTGSIIGPNTTSPGSNCMLAGTNAGTNQFCLGSNASANNTTWTVISEPSGATGVTLASVTGQPSSTVAVDIATNATINATYTLKATANCYPFPSCESTSASYNFNVKPLAPTITAADGNACVPKGSIAPKTFNCVGSNGANYVWQFPAGWGTGAAVTTTTPTITISPSSSTAVLDGTVTVAANGITNCNSQATFTIGYSATAPTGVTASCWSTGVAGINKITFTNPLPGTYSATLIAVGGATNLITSPVTFTAPNILSFNTNTILMAGQQYNITITHNGVSGCTPASTSSTTLLTVTSGGSVTLTPTPGVGNGDTYQASGGSVYAWYVNNTLIPANTFTSTVICSANLLQLKGNGPAPTSVYVIITNGTGSCSTKAEANLTAGTGATHSTNKPTTTSGVIKTFIEGITIYPNPNDGNFNIQVDTFNEKAKADLTDATGKSLGSYTLSKGENKIQNEHLSKGTYFVILVVDGKQETRQIIVN